MDTASALKLSDITEYYNIDLGISMNVRFIVNTIAFYCEE